VTSHNEYPDGIGGVKVDLDFDCPFCGRLVATSTETCMVAHALPTCATYDRLDALAFLRAANDALGLPDAE
jgi:hypothetical protein